MKKSRRVTTLRVHKTRAFTTFLLASAALAVTGCGPSPEERQLAQLQAQNAQLIRQLENRETPFTSPAQCQQAGVDKEDCENGYKAALAAHKTEAPVYSSLQECIAIYGTDKCEPNQNNGGSGFSPFFMGYMMGGMGGGYDHDRRGYGYGVSPVYRDSRGYFRDRSGSASPRPAYRPSTTVTSPSMTRTSVAAQRAVTTSRGGIGASGSARASGGFSAGG